MDSPEDPRKGSFLYTLAVVLSRAFNPLYVAIPASLAACLKVSEGVGQAFIWWLLYITFSSLVPLADLLVRLRLGKISDFHITKREERTAPIIFNIFSIVTGVILIWKLGAPLEIVAMSVAGLGLVVITLVVNYWWKISLHAMGLFEICTLLVLIFRTWTFVLYNCYLILMLLGACWSRLFLKKHTPGQVITGSLVGITISILAFWALGLI